jgi:hypothetical protein
MGRWKGVDAVGVKTLKRKADDDDDDDEAEAAGVAATIATIFA